MNLQITTALLDSRYWISLVAVVFSSASGVLKAGVKEFDLFGVTIIAIATGLGGIFLARLPAIRFDISLPRSRFKS